MPRLQGLLFILKDVGNRQTGEASSEEGKCGQNVRRHCTSVEFAVHKFGWEALEPHLQVGQGQVDDAVEASGRLFRHTSRLGRARWMTRSRQVGG